MKYAVVWREREGLFKEAYFDSMEVAEGVASRLRDSTKWSYSYRRAESYQEILDFMHDLYGDNFRLERMFHKIHAGVRLWKEAGDWYHENILGAPEDISRYWKGKPSKDWDPLSFDPGAYLNAEETIYFAQYVFGAKCTGVWDGQSLEALGAFLKERFAQNKPTAAVVWKELRRYEWTFLDSIPSKFFPPEYLEARERRLAREIALLQDRFPMFNWEQSEQEGYQGTSEHKQFHMKGHGPPNLRKWSASIGVPESTAIHWDVCEGSFKEVLATLKEHLEMMTQWLS